MEFPEVNSKNMHSENFSHRPFAPEPKVLSSILEHIGHTPLVKINRIAQAEGLECDMYVKCEFFNAGGSVKDRIARRMVEQAEKDGILKPGCTIIEPTSGNTGIGLALAAAVKGYKAIITLPEKMSQEKVDILKALGAEIIRTPTEAAFDSPYSHIGVAKKLNAEIKDSVILDQYRNPYNPIAHYDETAEEILRSLDDQVDMLVAGAGTGGTITGIATKLKERCPNVKIVGVDPHGSILAVPESLNTETSGYKVEGIGYDFIPDVLDREIVDEWIKSNDKDSFLMARRLIREEGILCGGSSGTAMAAAIKAAKSLKKGQKCVVVLPDSIRNYMTKFLNDGWMMQNQFVDEAFQKQEDQKIEQWQGASIKDLNLQPAVTIEHATTCREAVSIMQKNSFDQLPVISGRTGKVVGLVTMGNILSRLSSKRATSDSPVSEVMFKFAGPGSKFKEITVDTPLADLNQFFELNSCALVTKCVEFVEKEGDEPQKILKVAHIITKVDLLKFLVDKNVL